MPSSIFNLRVPLPNDDVFLMNTLTDAQLIVSRDVMDLLDEHFQGSGNLDRDGTRRMLTATFLRFQNIKLIAMSSQARVDPQTPTLGRVEAQVLVTGAQGLIPERAEPYTVRMEWRLVGGDWKLADLRWDE